MGYDNVAGFLNDKTEEEAQRARAARIQRWKHDIQEDVGAMARWITAKVTNEACDVSQLGECPSKGAAAERLKASLDKLWGEAANFDARLHGFLQTLGPAIPAAEREVHFDGHLRRRARKAKRKAGGLDGWTGELVALPLNFFDKLARIWTAIIKGGRLPLGWKQVRVAGIPKPGWRSSSAGAYAAGMEVGGVRDAGAAAACAWMPECLHGGLPGRSVDAIKEQLGCLLDKRRRNAPLWAARLTCGSASTGFLRKQPWLCYGGGALRSGWRRSLRTSTQSRIGGWQSLAFLPLHLWGGPSPRSS